MRRGRGFKSETIPGQTGWVVEIDDFETRRAWSTRPAVAAVTSSRRETYGDFELDAANGSVAEGGNSGIFYRVVDEGQGASWASGPEMQILDNDQRHADAWEPAHVRAGALYAPRGRAPAAGRPRPAGSWNHARVVA